MDICLVLAQINSTVRDLAGNRDKILAGFSDGLKLRLCRKMMSYFQKYL
jgi:hypothetical protein